MSKSEIYVEIYLNSVRMLYVFSIIKNKKGFIMNVAIVGAGKLGQKLAYALLSGNHSVTVIDNNEKHLQKLSQQMDIMTVTGNGKDISVLKEVGISKYDFLLATTGMDELNITIAAFAKKLGCKSVIARVRDPEHMKQFDFIKETMHIDHIVNPDMAITNEIYKYLVEKYTLSNGIFSTGKVSLIEFKAKKLPEIVGLSMREVHNVLPNMVIAAISRKGKVIIPHGHDTVLAEDSLYVIGEKDIILELTGKVHETGTYTNLQKVMIIGGGKTGFYLSKKLSEFGVAVKIIERDISRCHYLAEKLEDVMILHGDGTDRQLLEDENIQDMDGFVTATGYDEDNLLLALMAKEYGIEDVIAKVSRGIYTELVSNLGVDMAISPVDIISSNLAKMIQGKKKILSNQLVQGQAEITEIIIGRHMKIANKSLRAMDLPKGVIIGAIQRGSELIIPNGDTVVKEGDRVLIFSLLTAMPEMAVYTR